MDVSKHVEKAQEAVRKKNFDYAIGLYHQVLQLKPDHGTARAQLRDALVRRAEYKRVPRLIALIQGGHNRISMLLGTAFKKPDQIILAAEKYLKHDPRNWAVNWALADALEKAGHKNSSVSVFEFLGDDEQGGDEALKRAGALYYSLGKMDRALGCYEVVLERSPRDAEAEKMRKNLAAEGVLSSGSYDPTKSSRELARDQDRMKEQEAEQKLTSHGSGQDVLLAKYRDALAQDPNDKRARKDLVDHFVKGRKFSEAIELLEETVQLLPDSFDFRERLGDVTILQFEQQIRETKAKADEGDVAAQTDLVDMQREQQDFEVEEFTRRVKEHPTDLSLRFKLGLLQLEKGQTDEAIENFQQSVKDPRRKVDSLLHLSKAFDVKGMLDLSLKQLDAARELVEVSSDTYTEVMYQMAVLQEKSGDLVSAKSNFGAIYEKDIRYRDVADRLERLSDVDAGQEPAKDPAKDPAKETTSPEGGDSGDKGSSPPVYGFKD